MCALEYNDSKMLKFCFKTLMPSEENDLPLPTHSQLQHSSPCCREGSRLDAETVCDVFPRDLKVILCVIYGLIL